MAMGQCETQFANCWPIKGLFVHWSGGWGVLFHLFHDDVIKWKHFPRYWPFVRGTHWSLVDSPHKGQQRGTLMFSLICAWKKELSKHSRRRWFETPSRSLWRRCNEGMGHWPHSLCVGGTGVYWSMQSRVFRRWTSLLCNLISQRVLIDISCKSKNSHRRF